MTEPVLLRDHIEAMFAERQRAIDIAFAASEAQLGSQRERVDLALAASQRAIDKAERDIEKRLELLNMVLEQRLNDFNVWRRGVDEFVAANRASVRAGDRVDEQHAVTLGQVVGVVTVVVTIAAILVGAFT